MVKYIYDKASGKVVEKPEKKSDVVEMLPSSPPLWFIELYNDYQRSIRELNYGHQ